MPALPPKISPSKQDNRHVAQEGETCNPSAFSTCTPMLADLKRMRWDCLNIDYHDSVLTSWKTGGCFNEIRKKLGYRFVLVAASLQDSARQGAPFKAELRITNIGCGKCLNPRGLELVLREAATKQRYAFTLSRAQPFTFRKFSLGTPEAL